MTVLFRPVCGDAVECRCTAKRQQLVAMFCGMGRRTGRFAAVERERPAPT